MNIITQNIIGIKSLSDYLLNEYYIYLKRDVKLQYGHIKVFDEHIKLCFYAEPITKKQKDETIIPKHKPKGSADMENKIKNKETSKIRSVTKVKDLIEKNKLSFMWTLTYEEEIEDRDIILKDFKRFKKNLTRKLGEKIPHVVVIEVQKERQKKTGKAVLHLHFCTDRWLSHGIIDKAWGKGFVYVIYNSDIFGVSSYITKYLKKDFEDVPESKKRYSISKGLEQPLKIPLDKTIDHYKGYLDNKGHNIKEWDNGLKTANILDLEASLDMLQFIEKSDEFI